MRIEQLRGRAGSFAPQIVRKHQRRLDGFEDKIVALHGGDPRRRPGRRRPIDRLVPHATMITLKGKSYRRAKPASTIRYPLRILLSRRRLRTRHGHFATGRGARTAASSSTTT